MWAYSLGVAELFLVLASRREIQIIFKKRDQKTKLEKQEVARGLSRSVLLDAVIFVPVSVLLMLAGVKPWVVAIFPEESVRVYGVYGAVAFGFPFAIFRRLIITTALKTMKDFASIVEKGAVKALEKSQEIDVEVAEAEVEEDV